MALPLEICNGETRVTIQYHLLFRYEFPGDIVSGQRGTKLSENFIYRQKQFLNGMSH